MLELRSKVYIVKVHLAVFLLDLCIIKCMECSCTLRHVGANNWSYRVCVYDRPMYAPTHLTSTHTLAPLPPTPILTPPPPLTYTNTHPTCPHPHTLTPTPTHPVPTPPTTHLVPPDADTHGGASHSAAFSPKTWGYENDVIKHDISMDGASLCEAFRTLSKSKQHTVV